MRADLFWAPVLVVSAGMSLLEVPSVDAGWLSLLMIVLAYPAGRWMASLSVALWVFVAVTFAGLGLAFWYSPDPVSVWLSVVVAEFVASVLPWWAGRYRRLRAEQRERERGIVADQARMRERARIAQDMHDSLGHELALIALHGGALELASGLTDEQRKAAGELRACAVRATGQLHDIIQVLGSTAGLQPADETIDALVRRAAAAGMRVRLRGEVPAWSPMTSQAAHRVVQESLTNAARHAPGAPVTVTVGGTQVEVVNEAAAADAPKASFSAPQQGQFGSGTGQGLVGLDERVRLAGGRLVAGPRDGGWAVTAVLPDGAEPSPGEPPAVELGVSRKLTRRRLRQTAALPVAIGLVLVGALVLAQVITVTRIGLADEQYDQLRPGQSRTDVERVLPPHDLSQAPRVVSTPVEPAGTACVYYQAGTGLYTGPHVYQLCFAGDVLVSKTRLERG